MALWMSQGKISVTQNSKTVVGIGTAFLSAVVPARPGQPIVVNGNMMEIAFVHSDESLTLALPYVGVTASNVPYFILTTMEGSYNDLARRAAQVMGYFQAQLDGIQQLLTETGDVTLIAPDGTQLTVPSIYAIGQSVRDHEAKNGAHKISGVEGLQSELGERVLTSGGSISNLRRDGQAYGSLISNVASPLPINQETTVHNSFSVRLQQGWSDTMVRFRLVVRDYVNKHRNVDITFSGYVSSGSENWVAAASEASAVGPGSLDWKVFTHKGQDGKPVVYFFNSNGFDDYSTVEIVDDVSRGVQPVYSIGRTQGYDGDPVKVSRHYHSNNILGPVSKAGGEVTGAIIERGANTSGEYIKFADGTMVCTATVSKNEAVQPGALLLISPPPPYQFVGKKTLSLNVSLFTGFDSTGDQLYSFSPSSAGIGEGSYFFNTGISLNLSLFSYSVGTLVARSYAVSAMWVGRWI